MGDFFENKDENFYFYAFLAFQLICYVVIFAYSGCKIASWRKIYKTLGESSHVSDRQCGHLQH